MFYISLKTALPYFFLQSFSNVICFVHSLISHVWTCLLTNTKSFTSGSSSVWTFALLHSGAGFITSSCVVRSASEFWNCTLEPTTSGWKCSGYKWLVEFGRKAHARGDIVRNDHRFFLKSCWRMLLGACFWTQYCLFQVFILLDGQTGQIGLGFEGHDAANERRLTSFALWVSALSVALLWRLLPHISLCAVMWFGWSVRQHISWVSLCHRDANLP